MVDDAGFDDGAGTASIRIVRGTIGAVAGAISSTTAFFWWFNDWRGKLPEPPEQSVEGEKDMEVRAEPPLGYD